MRWKLSNKVLIKNAPQHKNIMLGIAMLMFLLTFLPLASAVPPVTQVQAFTEGYVIEGTPQEFIKQNTDFQYNFFVYNISTGKAVTSPSIECQFYIANNVGSILVFNNATYSAGERRWGTVISGGNFSAVGHYPFGVKCNSTIYGGAKVSYFEITNDGKEKSPVNFIAIIAGLLGVCILCFALSKILKAKPLKILFLFVGMIMMLFILSTANLMLLSSDGSVSTSNIHENLGMPYTILMWSIIFTFLYFIVTYFIDTLKDMQTKKKIDRGDMEDEE